jgi:hypothetical protein
VSAAAVARVRERYAGGGTLLGHSGTSGPDIAAALRGAARPASPSRARAAGRS